jgi:hypothetical protein
MGSLRGPTGKRRRLAGAVDQMDPRSVFRAHENIARWAIIRDGPRRGARDAARARDGVRASTGAAAWLSVLGRGRSTSSRRRRAVELHLTWFPSSSWFWLVPVANPTGHSRDLIAHKDLGVLIAGAVWQRLQRRRGKTDKSFRFSALERMTPAQPATGRSQNLTARPELDCDGGQPSSGGVPTCGGVSQNAA